MRAAFNQNAEVYKQNIKKVIRLMVDDVWSEKRKKVLRDYSDTNPNTNGRAYFNDNDLGPYYYIQEQNRLKKIVKNRVVESIAQGRSEDYELRKSKLEFSSMLASGYKRPKVEVCLP